MGEIQRLEKENIRLQEQSKKLSTELCVCFIFFKLFCKFKVFMNAGSRNLLISMNKSRRAIFFTLYYCSTYRLHGMFVL